MAGRTARHRRAFTTLLALLLALGLVAIVSLYVRRSFESSEEIVVATFGSPDPLDPPIGASFAGDDFSGPELDDRWRPVDLDGSLVALRDGSLVIEVPAGTDHGAWGELDRPRLALDVADEDFIIDVTFADLPALDGQAVGLSFEQDPASWIAIDISSGPGLSVQALSTERRQTTVVGASAVAGRPEIVTLRVAHQGGQWNIWLRSDDGEFVEVAAFSRDLDLATFALGAGARTTGDEPAPPVVATVLGVSNVGSNSAPLRPTVEIDVVGDGGYTLDPALDQLSFGDELIVRAEPAAGWELAELTGPGTTEGSAHRVLVDSDLRLTLTFRQVSTEGAIDIWYGLDQTFGIYGRSQNWINVLGNVSDPDGIEQLSYSLNSGPQQQLGIGPDQWRLGDLGDFNVELAFDDLELGVNRVDITAVDTLGNSVSESVTVRLVDGDSSLRPIQIDWAEVGDIQDVVQVVDGHFEIRDDTLEIVSPDRNRLLLIGDQSWTDYELTAVVTPIALDATVANPMPGPSNIFLAGGWQGHVDWQGQQPQIGYWPTGVLALVSWPPLERIQLTGNEEIDEIIGPRTPMRFGVAYTLKFRVETVDEGVDYRFKIWPEGGQEPSSWDLVLLETNGPRSGSIGLAAHHLDVAFGPITVVPL